MLNERQSEEIDRKVCASFQGVNGETNISKVYCRRASDILMYTQCLYKLFRVRTYRTLRIVTSD
jgi:hypothetical protein